MFHVLDILVSSRNGNSHVLLLSLVFAFAAIWDATTFGAYSPQGRENFSIRFAENFSSRVRIAHPCRGAPLSVRLSQAAKGLRTQQTQIKGGHDHDYYHR